MKRSLIAIAMAAASFSVLSTDVGISVSVSQPGFYGRIEIGDLPRPVVINTRPVIVERRPVVVHAAPIFLRVPPGHRKHWSKHCHEYQACGVPVQFVDERWYNDVYLPRQNGRGNDDRERGHGRDERHDDHRGHGPDHKPHGRD